MNCTEVQEQLSAYYDGELAGDVRQAIDSHLATCESCARQVDRFRDLSALAQQLTQPEPPSQMWATLERQLDDQQVATGVHAKATLLAWLTRPRMALLTAAAVVLVAVGLGWMVYRSGQTSHDHLAVDFAKYVDEFRSQPQAAQQLLLARYSGKSVGMEEAAKELGYVPAVRNGLPEDYQLEAVYVWNMPCCKCVQSVCRRRDGTTVAIFEHNDDQPTWFGQRPSVDVHCNGRPCQIYDVDSQLAASWRSGRRQITVVGLRDVQDISELVAHLSGTAPATPGSTPG